MMLRIRTRCVSPAGTKAALENIFYGDIALPSV